MPLLSTLLPPRCPVCATPGTVLCVPCWRRLRPAAPAVAPGGFDACRALLAYEGTARAVLVALKYRNERTTLDWLTAAMAALVVVPATTLGVEAVTWAPTTVARRRTRGYDQAALLARGVARRLALPCRPLLVRPPGPPQTGRDRAARRHGPAFLVAPAAGNRPPPAAVLVVDDVLTTGTTMSAAARALRDDGVRRVVGVTAARTPLKVPAPSVDP